MAADAGDGVQVFSEWRRQFDIARTPYDARVALGVAFYETSADLPGGPFQPLDGDLTSLAGATGTAIYYRSAADTWAPVTMGVNMTFSGGVLNATVPPPQFTTGDAKVTFKIVADTGWVIMDNGTIGSASSGSSTRANADTQPLFVLLFNNISDTYAPLLDSGGSLDARGSHASAAAAFSANCRMTLPRQLGRMLTIAGDASFDGLGNNELGQWNFAGAGGADLGQTFWNIMIKL